MKYIYRCSLLTVCIGLAIPVSATQYQANSGFSNEMSDQHLDSLRGRFVSKQGISFFGIQFVSSITHGSATQNAQMNLTIDTRGGQPSMAFKIGDGGEVSSSSQSYDPSQIQGSGLVQVVQIQGAANSSVNATTISQQAPSLQGQTVNPGQYQQSGPVGQVNYFVNAGQVGLQMKSSDGKVLLEQSLRGTAFNKGILQLNSVNGEGISTLNKTQIWFSR